MTLGEFAKETHIGKTERDLQYFANLGKIQYGEQIFGDLSCMMFFTDAPYLVLPKDMLLTWAGPDMVVSYRKKDKYITFLQSHPLNFEVQYNLFVETFQGVIYLGARYINQIDIQNRIIFEGYGWKSELIL